MDPTTGSYESWTEQGKQATLRGDFKAALDAYARAKASLDENASRDRLDVADLNLAMVRVQMGEAKRGEEGLREILLRTDDPRTAFTAAYHIASSLRKQGRYDRASSYATRALDRARALGATDLLAAGHNLVGNIRLNQNNLDEALESYEASLDLRRSQEGDTRYSMAILLENLGYCQLQMKRYDGGITRINEARTLAEEVGDRRCLTECLQDLCYGYLLQGENTLAVGYGESALAEAVEAGYEDIEENCHYLLGELGSKLGEPDRRDEHFQRLQDMHPELPFLKEFLCAVDITNIITLKR